MLSLVVDVIHQPLVGVDSELGLFLTDVVQVVGLYPQIGVHNLLLKQLATIEN